MVNYSLAKIYKIVDNTNGNIYVGSTCEPTLARRLAGHVGNYKQYLKDKYRYMTSYDIIKNDDYDIVLLDNYPCETKDQLSARERYYIEKLDCVNKVIPGRTHKETNQEYYVNNKEKIILASKLYRDQNKDKISQQDKVPYYCECGTQCTTKNRLKHLRTLKHLQNMKSKYINYIRNSLVMLKWKQDSVILIM